MTTTQELVDWLDVWPAHPEDTKTPYTEALKSIRARLLAAEQLAVMLRKCYEVDLAPFYEDEIKAALKAWDVAASV